MEKYKIDKDVKLPEPRSQSKFPFKDMEVGDSFLVPAGEDKYMSYNAWFAGHGKKKNRKEFVCRKEEAGTRVFRVPFSK